MFKLGEKMEEVVKTETQVPAQSTEPNEAQKTWQEFLNLCCQEGQIQDALEQLDSQVKEIEKQLDVTQQARKKARNKHKEMQQAQRAKVQAVDADTTSKESH